MNDTSRVNFECGPGLVDPEPLPLVREASYGCCATTRMFDVRLVKAR